MDNRDMDFRVEYYASNIFKTRYQSESLKEFKKQVAAANINRKKHKKEPVKDPNKEKIELIKHNQNLLSSSKRGIANFDFNSALKLIDGRLHDQDLEDEESIPLTQRKETNVHVTDDHTGKTHQEQILQFEKKLDRIIHNEDPSNPQGDEIPSELRKELDLPDNITGYAIDMHKIKEHDFSVKKFRPIWSGQDVFPDRLDHH
jgi:hypothetical protein